MKKETDKEIMDRLKGCIKFNGSGVELLENIRKNT